MRHGAKKIATVTAGLLLAILGILLYLDVRKKENNNVLQKIYSEAEQLIRDARVVSSNKSVFVVLSEVLRPGSFKTILDGLSDEIRLGVAKDVYTEYAWYANSANPLLRKKILLYVDSVLHTRADQQPNATVTTHRFRALNMLIIQISHHLYFYKDVQLQGVLKGAVADLRELVLKALVTDVKSNAPDINAIDDALEHLLNNNALSEADIQKILTSISPFEGEAGLRQFNLLFPVGKRVNYCRGNRFDHNGGYQQLAYLYAALGKIDPIKSSIDSLLKYNLRYPFFVDNSTFIATYLYRYGHYEQLHEMIGYYCSRQEMSRIEYYERWLNNCGIFEMDFSNKLWVGENHSIVLDLLDENSIRQLFDFYADEIRKTSNGPDELHFNLALCYKHRGALLSKMTHDGHATATPGEVNDLFSKSIEEYRQVAPAYLDKETPYFVLGKQPTQIIRKSLFLYPDHVQKVVNGAFLVPGYYSASYLNYIVDNNLVRELYPSPKEMQLIYIWLKNYNFEDGTSSTSQVEKTTRRCSNEIWFASTQFSHFFQTED